MEKRLLICLLFFLSLNIALAQIEVSEFYSPSCPHCANVVNSGILEKIEELKNVNLNKYDITSEEGSEKYLNYHKKIDMPSGVPLLIVEKITQNETNGENITEEINFLIGDKPIIENSIEMINNISEYKHKQSFFEKIKCFVEDSFESSLNNGKLSVQGLFVLILAAIIDSINPCAFGVLLFLMISLLNLGSSKRALKIGLFYTLIVFIVYFLAGFGIFSIIQKLTSIRNWIYLFVGIIVLLMSFIEFRDYIMSLKGKESLLRISPKIKPFIEKYSKKGTILAILILGIVVSLFELPCTGGVYIAIITMLSKHVTASYFYLFLYNIIFVLPLIVLTLLVYKGISPERLQKWNTQKRSWMKLGASVVMFLLALYLVWNPIKTIFGFC